MLRLAKNKALAVNAQTPSGSLILAADTTVAVDGEIFGKPLDEFDAKRMLRRLRGRPHHVYTAVALIRTEDDRLLTDLGETLVPMRSYSNEEIDQYIQRGDPFDKAGAYAIQHAGFRPVDGLTGCYANVVGLPLCHLRRILRKMGVQPDVNVPSACQAALDYQCPVYEGILEEKL